jgi:hypothetical protein
MANKPKKTSPSIKVKGNIPKLSLDMPLDEAKIKAIQRCVAKGRLTLTLSNVDLAGGKIDDAWLYD